MKRILEKITNWIKKIMSRLFKTYNTSTKEKEFVEEIPFNSVGFGISVAKFIGYSGSVSSDTYILDKDGGEFTIPNNSVFFGKVDINIIASSTGQTMSLENIVVIKRYGGVTYFIHHEEHLNHYEGGMNAAIDVDVEAGIDGEIKIHCDVSVVETFKVTAVLYGTLATI